MPSTPVPSSRLLPADSAVGSSGIREPRSPSPAARSAPPTAGSAPTDRDRHLVVGLRAGLRLVAPGFNRFSRERPEWHNGSALELYGWSLADLCSLHDLIEQPALLGRSESTDPGKTIVAKGTVEGSRGAIAAIVDASQINADLHIRFFPAATIAYCHVLILAGVGVRTPKLDAEQTVLLLNSSSNVLASCRPTVSKPSVTNRKIR